jgi:Domain of unknown function (DUF3786)
MARIDDYQQAREIAAQALAKENIEDIARRAGFETQGAALLTIPFLDRTYSVSYPQFEFKDRHAPEAQVPLQEQVLILHYLQGSRPRLAGRWVAYREIPGAGFYFGAFVKRAVEPFKKVFGQNTAALQQAAAKLGGAAIEAGTVGFRLDLLPYAPIQMILWQGDDEFPAEANILFDAAVGDYLSAEDAAWLASLAVYRLMALSRTG